MGAAWCRERIEQAQNSKSPVDRIITRCSNAINAKTIYSKPNQSKPANDIVFRQIRYPIPTAVPVHKVPPPRTHHGKSWKDAKGTTWTDIPLSGENVEPMEKTPVPPPRRRKKRKINSLEVLNSQLDKIYESRKDLKSFNEKSQLLFGDPLPAERAIRLSPSSSPERTSPSKFNENEHKRKSRAKKIMESKTRISRREMLPLSVAKPSNDIIDVGFTSPQLVKNVSTISLPCYQEFQNNINGSFQPETEIKTRPDGPKRNISSISLPGDSVLTAISGVTMNRLEAYMKRCKSFGSLKPQQLLEKLEEITNKQESESSDSWSGLDDWDLGVIEYCDADPSGPPLVPKCRLTSKQNSRLFELGPPSDLPQADLFPESPSSLRREISISDSAFIKPRSTQEWFSTPSIPLENKVKTPPPTPDERDIDIKPNAHSTLLEILSDCNKFDDESIPTPPKRKIRDFYLRRQSYQAKSESSPTSYLMTRSLSLDTTLDDVKPNLKKNWDNLSASCSQHSLQQALANFLGYEDPPLGENDVNDSLVEINLNSSLFPVIGLESEDKGVTGREMEDDRKTPSPLPPPLPSSPPPIVSKPSSDLSPT